MFCHFWSCKHIINVRNGYFTLDVFLFYLVCLCSGVMIQQQQNLWRMLGAGIMHLRPVASAAAYSKVVFFCC